MNNHHATKVAVKIFGTVVVLIVVFVALVIATTAPLHAAENLGPRFLPMIRFKNESAGRYEWWTARAGETPADANAEKWLSEVHVKLQKHFLKNGLFLLDPIRFPLVGRVPQSFRLSEFSPTDLNVLSDRFSVSHVLRGDVTWDGSKMNFSISVVQGGSGRVVADIQRTSQPLTKLEIQEVSKVLREQADRLAADLAEELAELDTAGRLDANRMLLSLKSELSGLQLSEFKKFLENQFVDIKSLKEFLFSPEGVTFEMETPQNTRILAEQFAKKSWGDFRVRVLDVGPDRLALSVAQKEKNR